MTVVTLEGVLADLRHTLQSLRHAKSLLRAKILVSHYVTTWCSLNDVVALLVNDVFELGIAEQDLNLQMVLRNSHIQTTNLRAIIKKYRVRLRTDVFHTSRNDIIHRGKLNIPELKSIEAEEAELHLLAILDPTLLKTPQSGIMLNRFVKSWVPQHTKHLAQTISLLNDISVRLEKAARRKLSRTR